MIAGRFLQQMMKACMVVNFSLVLFVAPLSGQMKLREELVSRQREGGYTLASFGHGSIYAADFTRRDEWLEEKKLPPPADRVQDGLLSPDGTLVALFFRDFSGAKFRNSLGIMQRDGSGVVEFPDTESASCWSTDSQRLIVWKPSSRLPALLDLESGRTEEIAGLRRAWFTTQCWSPDGQRLVYHVLEHDPIPWTPENSKKKELPNPGTIYIYDIAEKKAHEVGRGQDPTWSPDGQWIAYWNEGAEWRIRPSGEEAQRMFKRKEPESPLLWSPDSRLALYFHCCYLVPSLRCMCDVGHWFVRRLADHAEVRVGEESPYGHANVWVRSRTQP